MCKGVFFIHHSYEKIKATMVCSTTMKLRHRAALTVVTDDTSTPSNITKPLTLRALPFIRANILNLDKAKR